MKDKSSKEPGPSSTALTDELLSAYFDGEVSGPAADTLRASLLTDPKLSQSLRELELVQATLREVVRQMPGDPPLSLAIWDRIEHRLEPYPQRRSASLPQFIESLRRRFAEATGAASWGRPAWGIAAACAAAALVLASQAQWPGSTRSTAVSMVSGTSVRDNGRLEGNQASIPVVAMTGSTDMIQSNGSFVNMPLGSARGQRSPFLQSVPMRIDRGQLIGMDPELRTDGLDIERIKTKGPFKIVASNGRKAPPVIWVARGGQAMDARQ